ncbi:50S ribosomal protein L6 [Candidatus Woesearchaeota archaeon]|nr:50S ribosomal protein L6 [Candidatus Woesearchaeota archaeon]
MTKKNIEEKIPFPEKVEVTYQEGVASVKGPLGEVKRKLYHPSISLQVEGKNIILKTERATLREKTQLYTWRAHLLMMIKGVTQGHFYKLKVCSGHFPMNVTLSGNQFSVKNFLGEKIPRVIMIPKEVKVTIDGDYILVESNNKELAGQTAASMEQLTRVTNKDLRIFQDGFYIIEKNGKSVI